MDHVHSHQTERSEDREAGNVGQPQLDEGQGDDDEVKDVPAFLEVKFRTHGHLGKKDTKLFLSVIYGFS
jgi:hypothetical protein